MLRLMKQIFGESLLRHQHLTSKVVHTNRTFPRTYRRLTTVAVLASGVGWAIASINFSKDEDVQQRPKELQQHWAVDAISLLKERLSSLKEAFCKGDIKTNQKKTDSSWKLKVLNDPIHGHIALDEVCVEIVDTPQFQRLRHLKQLGGGYFVYPGASHNRFEHSIGVCHLAGELAETLQKRHPKLINDKDVLCIKIAGLCHDLGHGPFSHVFDTIVLKHFKHENASLEMFDHMIRQNSRLKRILIKHEIMEENDDKLEGKHLNFIRNLINPPADVERKTLDDGRGNEKIFLYAIVANKNSEVDVDKWDYFARDCHHLGMRSSFDHKRFIHFARIIKHNGKWQLCIRDIEEASVICQSILLNKGERGSVTIHCSQEAFNVYQLFQTRHALHRKAYKHRVTSAVECMLADILNEAKDVELIPGESLHGQAPKKLKIPECIKDMHAYTNLTDDVLQMIRVSEDKRLKKSQELIKALYSRNLYRCVAQTTPFTLNNVPEVVPRSVEQIEQLLAEETKIPRERIKVQEVILDFGKKKNNPVDEQLFYTKEKPDEAKNISQTEVSYLLPKETFQERIIRVYLKQGWTQHLTLAEHNKEECDKLKKSFNELCDRLYLGGGK